jgi:hypothetical protein
MFGAIAQLGERFVRNEQARGSSPLSSTITKETVMDFNDNINLESGSQQQSYKPPSMFQFVFEKLTGDMKFVGTFTIVYGVLTCLTIIGALIGIPTIIIGLRIREAAEQFSMYRLTNNSTALRQGFELQAKYFRLIKILIIIGLVFTVLYIIFIIYLFTVGINQFFHSAPSFQSS